MGIKCLCGRGGNGIRPTLRTSWCHSTLSSWSLPLLFALRPPSSTSGLSPTYPLMANSTIRLEALTHLLPMLRYALVVPNLSRSLIIYQVVDRDHSQSPVAKLYNSMYISVWYTTSLDLTMNAVCYVNAFQTQPEEADFWKSATSSCY
jgi:hypothetical protein